MWEKIKQKLKSAGKADDNTVVVEPQASGAAQQQSSPLGTLLREAMKAVGPLIATFAANTMAGGQPAAHNGHDAAESQTANPS
jgi:hypothetical protein